MPANPRTLDVVMRASLGALLPSTFVLLAVAGTQRVHIYQVFFLVADSLAIIAAVISYALLRRQVGLRRPGKGIQL